MKKILYNKNILSILIVVLFFAVSAFFYKNVESSQFDNIEGFAWASDEVFGSSSRGGISWISFNSADCDADGNNFIDGPSANGRGYLCGSDNASVAVNNYGVNLDINTGNIVGYAWSPIEGWIKFGGFNPAGELPVDSGVNATNVKVDFTGSSPYKVYGWARICAYAENPITCRGNSSLNPFTGGMDGWISFNSEGIDSNPNPSVYSVYYDSTAKVFTGYAWASDSGQFDTIPSCVGCDRIHFGWISFNCIDAGTCGTVNYKVKYNDISDPRVVLTASPNPIARDTTTKLSWTGVNIENSIDGCEGDVSPIPPGDTWDGSLRPSPSGTYTTVSLPEGVYEYKIRCRDVNNHNNFSPWSSITVISGDTTRLDFYADPSVAVAPNFQTTLKWRDDPDAPGLTNCIADSDYPLNPNTIASWDGALADPSSTASQVVDAPYATTFYKITCDNRETPARKLTQTISVKRKYGESLKLVASKPVANVSTLSWTVTNVESGSCHPTNSPAIPAPHENSWLDPDPKVFSPLPPQAGTGFDDDVWVPSTGTYTYTLTCTGLYSGEDLSVYVQFKDGKKTGSPGYKET